MPHFLLFLMVISTGLFLSSCSEKNSHFAEKLLTKGVIYTANDNQQIVTTIGIAGDKLVFVGNFDEASAVINEKTEIIDLNGRMIIPGLHDVHIHLPGIVDNDNCDLNSQPFSLANLAPRIKECIVRLNLPEGEWLTVEQWEYSQGNEPSDDFPTIRSALDEASLDHPIVLLGHDGHHGAVNSYALGLATDKNGLNVGLNKTTLNNEFSSMKLLIGIDQNGEPNGILKEDARKLVNLPNLWGYPKIDLDLYEKISRRLSASGITSTMDAALRIHEIDAFAKWANVSPLSYRLTAAFYPEFEDYRPEPDQPIDISALINDIKRVQFRHKNVSNLKIDTAKIFVDGVIEGDPHSHPPMLPNAAALDNYLQPIFDINDDTDRLEVIGYVDTNSDICESVKEERLDSVSETFERDFLAEYGFSSSQCRKSNGILEKEYQFILDYTIALHKAGINVHSHAIGDRAVQVALDTFEAAMTANPSSNAKFSIAHAQLIHPDDIARIGDLNVAIAFTYSWIEPSTDYQMTVSPFIEPIFSEAALFDPAGYVFNNSYPVASVKNNGGMLVAGSDAPVEERDPRPMLNLEKAVTRANEVTGQVFNANEKISIQDALDAYTINGAELLGQAHITGSLEKGKKADFVILSQDLIKLEKENNADKISDTKILSTWFDGQEIYSSHEQ